MTTLTQLSAKALATTVCPELELLLHCARTNIDPQTAERIKVLLQQDINWTYLIQVAAQHGVMPLLYFNLKSTYPEAVPKAVLNYLQDCFHSNALNNLLLTKELLKLLNFFQEEDISAISFKGPTLAASAYSNLALRQFCDLDILVHERDFLKVKKLLISQGYRLHFDGASAQEVDRLQTLTEAQEALYLQSRWEQAFIQDSTRANVDLHQKITPVFPLVLADFWPRRKPVSLAGEIVTTLSPEDLLLVLCVNGAKDRWAKILQLCDVAEIIHTHPEIDWKRVIEQSRRLGSERMVLLGVLLASEILGTTLPEEVLQRIQLHQAVKLLAVQICNRFFSPSNNPLGASEIENFLFQLRLRERLQDKVQYCFSLMNLSPGDWAFLPLPIFLHFLYYLLRPIRLISKYALKGLDHKNKTS